jgi:hypothetical protein
MSSFVSHFPSSCFSLFTSLLFHSPFLCLSLFSSFIPFSSFFFPSFLLRYFLLFLPILASLYIPPPSLLSLFSCFLPCLFLSLSFLSFLVLLNFPL